MDNYNQKFEIFPLFASPLAVIKVQENFSNLKKIITDYEFIPTASVGAHNSYRTKNLNILDSFLPEKNIIFEYFNAYKNDFLKIKTTNFKITSSWVTKTKEKGFSQFHNHKNSVYSGVFYFDDVSGGNLQFESYGLFPQQILLNAPSEWEVFNSTCWELYPEKNMLLFFPSYLYHRITTNNSFDDRYSLAFNLFPENCFGIGDSSINIEVK